MKSATKNAVNVTLRLSSNKIGANNTNFLHKLLLTDRQVSSFCKAFANSLLIDVKLIKT